MFDCALLIHHGQQWLPAHFAELGSLQMDVAVPILGSAPCDKVAYHKGLKSVEQKLEVLDAQLRSRTFLVSTCKMFRIGQPNELCNVEARTVAATAGTVPGTADGCHGTCGLHANCIWSRVHLRSMFVGGRSLDSGGPAGCIPLPGPLLRGE